jgi:hypothetical protein
MAWLLLISKELIWRGTATGVADSAVDYKEGLNEAVTRMLEKFPPNT